MRDSLVYHLAILDHPKGRIGLFQVKIRFSDMASLDLIRASVEKLVQWCKQNPTVAVNLNFPGIGNGGLSEAVVRPLLDSLPDQVRIWKRS
jgi:hypothetical protein